MFKLRICFSLCCISLRMICESVFIPTIMTEGFNSVLLLILFKVGTNIYTNSFKSFEDCAVNVIWWTGLGIHEGMEICHGRNISFIP